jgi:fimbrial isopeptide formation D2 family protein/LPXTG-motif cell wall-anchored protein
MKNRNLFRRLCSAAVAVASLISLAVPVSAATTEAAALPDTTSARSLTIYKYDNVTNDSTNGNGHYADVNTTVHRPMKNVIFDIYYYADLDSNVPTSITESQAAAWVKTNSSAQKATIVTDEYGKATWNASAAGKSADGIYLVVERDNRAIQVTGKAEPFFVSLPYTDTNSAQWIYDVVVQPKNALVAGPTVNKDVTSYGNKHDSARVDETMTWILRGTVPADLYYTDAVNNTVVEYYADDYTFIDKLDTQLTYKGNVRLSVLEQGKEEYVLHEDDYVISGTATKDVAGGTLKVSLTDFGKKDVLQHVTNYANAEILVYFDFTINSTAVTGDEIPNDVTLTYTNSTGLTYADTTVPTDDIPEVHLGGLKIEKVDVANTNTKLAGAEFHIATSEENALAGTYLTDVTGTEITLTTDEHGLASYTGLYFDNQSTTPAKGTYYWLVETKAPEGYQLNSKPIRVEVNPDTYRDNTVPYQITNSTKFDLPLTGSDGASKYLIMGLCILAGAIVVCSCGVISIKKVKRNNIV